MCSKVDKRHLSEIKNDFFDKTGFTQSNGVVLPKCFEKFEQRIQDMEVRDDDIWVCSLMKTGSTWCQEMTWCIANDLDFEGAKEYLQERFPFLELTPMNYETIMLKRTDLKLQDYWLDSVQFINNMKSPRFIKSHLPYELLPKKLRDQSTKAKIVYIARNPKDTCLSYYHFLNLVIGQTVDFEEMCELFTSDSIYFSPYFDHILGYWKRKDDSRLLFLKFEDMKRDLRSVIRRTAQFLGKDLLDDQVSALEDHLSFKSMKNNEAVNYKSFVGLLRTFGSLNTTVDGQFMRSGKVGEGKKEMSPEYVKVFDEWEKKSLEKTGLSFN